MPDCLTDEQKEFLIEQILSDKIDEESQRAVELVAKVHTCGVPPGIPVAGPAPRPAKLPPPPEAPLPAPGKRTYKTERHAFMSDCMRGPDKGGCGLPMKDCSDRWKQGEREKPC